MQIEILISELIMRHNCVVIPGFGGFIASQSKSEIDFSKGIISSPKKSILFNKQLINSDGLLVNSFSIKNKISFEEANLQIQEKVKLWNEGLHNGKRISFEKVGFLFLDNEKNLCFEQDKFFNLLMDSFGMGQVEFYAEEIIEQGLEIKPASLEKIENEQKVEETPIIELFPNFIKPIVKKEKDSEQEIKVKEITLPKPTKSSRKKLLKYVAAACILPIAFYSVWIPMKSNVLESGMLSLNDFNPFQLNENPIYNKEEFKTKLNFLPEIKSFEEQIKNLPKDLSVYSMEIDDELFFVRLNENKTENSENQEQKNVFKTLAINEVINTNEGNNSTDNFQIIVGSFSNENNAEQLKQELINKGFNAYTFSQSNGLIRVSAGKTNSISQAEILVSKLTIYQIPSWVLK
jgi:hypothetical protein